MSELYFVTGATGAQGGSVARHLLAQGKRVRAATRDLDTPRARALRDAGAELVQVDLRDVAALTDAMRGANAVFGVTNFWEHYGCETVHGRNVVDAARRNDVEQLVLSSLPSAEALSHGAIAVPHFETKAAVESYARSSGLCATFVHVAFYFENFLSYFPPRADDHGVLRFGFPQGDTKLAGIAVEDLGEVLAPVFRDRERFQGRTVGVVSEELHGDEYAAVLSEVLGREVRYTPMSREQFASLPFRDAADLAAMFDLNRRFILTRAREIKETHELAPKVQSFETWARAHEAELRGACC